MGCSERKGQVRVAKLSGARFGFGSNGRDSWMFWMKGAYSRESSLKEMLNVEELEGRRFIDIGSGSGCSSGRRSARSRRSSSISIPSRWLTRELKQRFTQTIQWTIEVGSGLDSTSIESLGRSTSYISWGGLSSHRHQLWRASRKMPSVGVR